MKIKLLYWIYSAGKAGKSNPTGTKAPKHAHIIIPGPCKQREILFETRHRDKHKIDEQTSVRDKVTVRCCCPGDLPTGKASAPQIHMYVYARGCMLIIINKYYTCIYAADK